MTKIRKKNENHIKFNIFILDIKLINKLKILSNKKLKKAFFNLIQNENR